MGSTDLLKVFLDTGTNNFGSFADAFDDGIFGSIAAGGNGIDFGDINFLTGLGSSFGS